MVELVIAVLEQIWILLRYPGCSVKVVGPTMQDENRLRGPRVKLLIAAQDKRKKEVYKKCIVHVQYICPVSLKMMTSL